VPANKTSKKEILKKAAIVFRKKGYFHTTISDLATACEIEKPHFYYYFKNKEEMMVEVLNYVDGLLEKYICDLAFDESFPPKERLSKMVERMNHHYLDGTGGCIFANTILETANVKEVFKPIVRRTFYKWAKALQFVLQSKYEENEAENLAYGIIQDLEGGLMLYQLYEDTVFMKSAAKRAIALL
jgi:TetR/AcrR family transcriptional repressor of nem operon